MLGQAVLIDAGSAGALPGDLVVSDGATGLVVFAHGSGSSRTSPRNRMVAEALQRRGIATLLMDLLTRDEEATDALTGRLRFDIDLLAERVLAAIGWARLTQSVTALQLGLFGASTGAAAALVAAAARPDDVSAVVSRGGRPDLAADALELVRAPSLLIVGSRDEVVIGVNEAALARMGCERRLEIVPGATHLFSEPGTLERVADLAGDWFGEHLAG